ncbi:redoxin domain-containing protein [Maribellus sediminis]|uniref:redoxin domain-containing protein n=1 Tax=Maribellus sediminis TaxID=2696285 RepID=UPI0014304A15|nr:redoxin domain-containing protein [Maribellus sediminis]
MKFPLLLFLLLIILGCKHEANNQHDNLSPSDTLILTTKKHKGYGSFGNKSTFLSESKSDQNSPWNKMMPTYKGIPDSLKNLKVSLNPVDIGQYVFQSYKAGKVDRSFLVNTFNSWGLDTCSFYDQELKSFFSVAIGQNSHNEWVYVIDKNNNLDFSDDKLYRLKKETGDLKLNSRTIPRQPVSFEYEYFDGKKVLRDSSWVYLFDYFSYGTDYTNFEYRVANFTFNNIDYEIELKCNVTNRDYSSKSTTLGITKMGEFVKQSLKSKNLLKIGDYLILDKTYFKIEKITYSGDSIYLRRDKNAEKTGGTQLGMKAIDFNSQTLEGEHFKLSDHRGKYVLLDFWGTWCAPCRKELTTLKEASDLFKDYNLVIVGIAKDSKQTLSQYLATNPLPWIQIPQHQTEDDSILNLYHVTSYPTTFLIDPDGKIIDKNLRGEPLIHKLRQFLYPTDYLKQFVLNGNTTFTLKEYEDADFITVTVYSEDKPDDNWNVMMYRLNGEWIGSLGLKPGNYTYEFVVDGYRIIDPQNNDSKYKQLVDRQVSVLKVSDESNLL